MIARVGAERAVEPKFRMSQQVQKCPQFTYTEAIVLDKRICSEDYVCLELLTPTYGKLRCFTPTYQRKRPKASIDLLDRLDVTLKQKQCLPTVIAEAAVLQKFYQLTRSYSSFLRAFQFTNSICKTLHSFGSTPGYLYPLVHKALLAWNAGKDAEVVFFKAFFLWIKHEGYPIVQDWVSRLPTADQAWLQVLLTDAPPIGSSPSKLPKPSAERLQYLNNNLIAWAQAATDLFIAV